jgi:protein-S-isoprenylcysteine O-methyltransferase Ste14
MTEPDAPGVIALPPVIYAIAILAAFVLQLLVPLEPPVSTPARWVAGVVVVLGIGVSIAGRRAFERAGTNVNPMLPAKLVVANGIYRRTRNPMYVGMAIACVALALATRNGWLLIALVPVQVLMHWGVILREERYLSRKFGAEYEAYRRSVRRYL